MFGQSLLSAFGSAACTTDTDQLFTTDVQTTSLATYQLNNATTSIPSNTYPGTASNITYAAGKFGNAAVFNGSSSKIVIPSQVSVSTDATDFNRSLWLSTNSAFTSFRGVIGANGNNSPVDFHIYNVSGNTYKLNFVRRYGGNYYLFADSSNFTLLPTTFYHLSINYRYSPKSIDLYINGSLVSTTTTVAFTGPQTAVAYECIGQYNGDGNYAAYAWNGKIDQVRIFDTALPQSAVTALYNETTTTATYPYVDYVGANPNSVAYYKMSDATDQLGNYNGTASNVNFNTEGKFGFAGAFNGSSSAIRLPDNSLNSLTSYTVSAWINSVSDQNNQAIVNNWGYANGNAERGWQIRKMTGNVIRVSNYNGGATQTFDSTGSVSLNTWTNITVTNTQSQVKIYINGTLDSTHSTGGFSPNASYPMRPHIGAYQYSAATYGFFDGKIDQIRIYDSAISAANVTALYNEIECPAVAVTNAFNTVLYDGNGTTKSITGVGFQPDFVWIKARNGGYYHILQDSVRGAGSGKSIYSNGTEAEGTYVGDGYTASFQSNGFTVAGGSSTALQTNGSGINYASWNWKAGGTAVSNTEGTTTSQVSANADAGFSIVSYSGTGANATVGHGLSSAPQLILQKRYEAAANWFVYSQAIGNTKYINLDTTGAAGSAVDVWNSTDPTNKVFSVSSFFDVNGSGISSIAYCFTSIPGYSKVGSYTGTGATGNFIYTGFEPAFVMIKNATSANNEWNIIDNKRSTSNPRNVTLWAQSSDNESTSSAGGVYDVNFDSNGFSIENIYFPFNQNNATFIFLAIA